VRIPYATDEILDYYESQGFIRGAPIGHLIFTVFSPEEQERRWRITLCNAEAFLKRHREKGCTFAPVGIVQGPSTALRTGLGAWLRGEEDSYGGGSSASSLATTGDRGQSLN
jgi:hypothetical protein